jgi:LIVCS family branched-chain amino acid:cation transporter
MFLYPLAITLSILALLERFCGKDKRIYRWVTILTAFAALFDALNQAPAFLKDIPAVQTMLSLWAHIPLFDHGLGWVLPALLGFVCGLIHQKLSLRYN